MSQNLNRLLFFLFPFVGFLSVASLADKPTLASEIARTNPPTLTSVISSTIAKPQIMLDTAICFGTCLNLGGVDYCDTGTYDYVDAAGDMQILNLTVRPANGSDQNLEICFGEIFQIDVQIWAEEGFYDFVYPDVNGCDSTVTYFLDILDEVPITVIDTFLCAGACFEPPFANSNKLCTTNFSEEVYQTRTGCDSIVRVNVLIGADLTNRSKQTICVNTCIGIGDSTICETGEYAITLESSTGCDSLVAIDLTVSDEIINEFRETICDGEEFEIADTVLATTGKHLFSYTSVLGCDSTVIVDLIVGEHRTSRESVNICAGDEFEVKDGTGSIIRAGGDYNFVFTSHLGCDSIVTFSVTQIDTINVTIVDTICLGDSIRIGTFSYGTSGVTRTVLTSEESCDSIVNLYLTVLDCRIEAETATDSTRCSDDLTGRFSFAITEGIPPFIYNWASADSSQLGEGTIDSLNKMVVVEGKPAGVYTAYVTDSIGIKAAKFVFDIQQPEYLTEQWTLSEFNGYNVSCASEADGTLEVAPSGGTGDYTYEWSTGASTPRLTNLASGNYTVTIKDALNCSFIVDTFLTAPPPIEVAIEAIKPNCDSFATGIIKVLSAEGGVMPLDYNLSGFGASERNQFTGLAPGAYTLTVMDANNCATQFMYDLDAPDIPELDFLHNQFVELADSLKLDIQSNVDLETITWLEEPGLSCYDCMEPVASPKETTTYNFSVTSFDGCVADGTITINVDKKRDVFVPTIFSPNSDGLNDRLTVFGGPEVEKVEMIRIYARWGDLVFERNNFDANDPLIGWDGRFKGQDVNAGTYIWILKVRFLDGVVEDYQGDVVIR